MEKDLQNWKNAINEHRKTCYSLNHFTMKQILDLRKDLAKACLGLVAIDELPLQTFMLLEAVCRSINPSLLADNLKAIIPESPIISKEDGLEGGQKYFSSIAENEKFVLETDENDELDVFQFGMPRRKNSLETFTCAKETLEGKGYGEEHLLAALQHCGRRANENEIIAWVLSEDDDETVELLCERAKSNPQISDIVRELFGSEPQELCDESTSPIIQR